MKHNNKTTPTDQPQTDKEFSDSLFEQMTNITKAHAFDIVSEHNKELKEAIRELIRIGELEDITFTDEAATKLFQYWVNRAKTLSHEYK